MRTSSVVTSGELSSGCSLDAYCLLHSDEMATVEQIIGGMLLGGAGGGGDEGGPPPHKKRAPAARVAVDDGREEDVETDDEVSGDDTVGCKYCGIV